MASKSSNEFGWSLLKSILAKERDKNNVFFSPFSISVALSMTGIGAQGDTAAGMQKALCWGTNGDVIHEEFQSYIEYFNKPQGTCTLRCANRIFVEERFPILERFLIQTKKFYFAESASAQFRKNPEAERIKINKWVEDITANKIKNLIQENVLNGDTKMVLVNAIYFKGDWVHKFDANDTSPNLFHVTPAKKQTVPTMNMSKHLPYYKAHDYAVLELPYKDSKISMAIFLPDETFGLEALEQRLTMTEIRESLSKVKSDRKVEVSLPKFEMNCSLSLKDVLSQLGMGIAFDANLADFTGIYDPRGSDEKLLISEVVHKAFLKVDEKGTEAAAATAVMMLLGCAMDFDICSFIVDHPFLVIIQDKTNDMVLFVGHVMDPSVTD